MAAVVIERVISVSSEDPAFPAENLLKSDNKKKWKCKAGEKQASAILQLKQDSTIEAIDIGNENSAFVEVLVGRSSSQTGEFKVLLLTSSLMTLKESKEGTNTNGVRFFKKADLTKPAVDEKWDRVKIVCTQPFNKHVQYGLSFVVLHSAAKQGEDSADSGSSLGKFALKRDEGEPAVGTWFAKRKDPPPLLPAGAAAAIRDASTPLGIAQGKLNNPKPKRPKVTTPKNGAMKPTMNDKAKKSPKPNPTKVKPQKGPVFNMTLADDEDSPADDTDADSTYSPNKDSASVLSDDDVIPVDSEEENSDEDASKRKKKRPKRDKKGTPNNGNVVNNGRTPKRKMTDAVSTAASKTKTAKMDSDRETKPFNRLLEGVTIVISGYQNPLRGELRSKACSMGARYKADWDPSCTHLICAFMNTPKFNQVRGRGKIIKKEWVEECHNRRRRLPWRRFSLDQRENGTSSEEEIWEEGSVPTTSNANAISLIASGVNRRRVSSGSDTEEEIEKVRARQTAKQTVKVKAETTATVTADPFTEDTDVDSGSECQTAQLPLPPLPDLFENIVFHIASDILGDERRKIHRYITAYKGCVVDEVDGSVEYVITKSQDIAAEVGEEFGITGLSPDWIWDCSDNQKLIPVENYIL